MRYRRYRRLWEEKSSHAHVHVVVRSTADVRRQCGYRGPAAGHPTLRVYKTGFAKGENIEFWLALKALTRVQLAALKKTGVVAHVVITLPSGKDTVREVDLAFGGLTRHCLLGYNSLRAEDPTAGRYRLQFSIGDRRLPLVFGTVDKLPIVKKIQASLRLEGASGFPESLAAAHAVLTVRNDTDQTVRFPRLTGMDGISLSVRRQSGDWTGHTFDTGWLEREQAGTRLRAAEFTWDAAEVLPTVTFQPGETFEQQISLQLARDSYIDAYKKELPVPPGRYAVTLSQTLNILIGDRHAAQAAYFPVRYPLKVTTEFTAGPSH